MTVRGPMAVVGAPTWGCMRKHNDHFFKWWTHGTTDVGKK